MNEWELYDPFVDYSKASDQIDKDMLWFKLINEGVRTRMLKAVKDMFNSVKSIIKYDNNFDVLDGVKQWDPLNELHCSNHPVSGVIGIVVVVNCFTFFDFFQTIEQICFKFYQVCQNRGSTSIFIGIISNFVQFLANSSKIYKSIDQKS